MSITPQDIIDKAFSIKFRGYNKEEVDEFLDKIYFDYEELVTRMKLKPISKD